MMTLRQFRLWQNQDKKLSCIAFLYIAVWFFTFVPQCAVRAAADFLATLRESREVRDN